MNPRFISVQIDTTAILQEYSGVLNRNGVITLTHHILLNSNVDSSQSIEFLSNNLTAGTPLFWLAASSSNASDNITLVKFEPGAGQSWDDDLSKIIDRSKVRYLESNVVYAEVKQSPAPHTQASYRFTFRINGHPLEFTFDPYVRTS